jgi:hypothetical protein
MRSPEKKEMLSMFSQQRLTALAAAAFGYLIKFMAYGFLTPVVLMTFAALVFTYITLAGPELPFLRQLAFLPSIDWRGNATITGEDIMNAFGLLTAVLFILSVLGGWAFRLLKRTVRRVLRPEEDVNEVEAPANQNPLSSLKRRLIGSSLVITVIYLVLFAVIPFARMAEGSSFLGMYAVFIVFYIVILISNAIYIGIDTLSSVIVGWAWTKVLNG